MNGWICIALVLVAASPALARPRCLDPQGAGAQKLKPYQDAYTRARDAALKKQEWTLLSARPVDQARP